MVPRARFHVIVYYRPYLLSLVQRYNTCLQADDEGGCEHLGPFAHLRRLFLVVGGSIAAMRAMAII